MPEQGSGPGGESWTLRALERSDVPAVADVHRLSMFTAMPWLPDLHTREQDLAYFAGQVDRFAGWVAVAGDRVVGYAIVGDGWLQHLYVAPGWQGHGIGSALLDRAKAAEGAGMQLWAFQGNTVARAFYARHGLVEVELTDGQGNEERHPDVRLVWPRQPAEA